MICHAVKQHIATEGKYAARMPKSAHRTLADNLAELMRAHADLDTRKKLAARAGISARSVGYMLQSGRGNPTLGHIEAVANAFRVPVWRLLSDSPTLNRMTRIAEILEMPAIDDSRLGKPWRATDTVAAEPPPPPYSPSKSKR